MFIRKYQDVPGESAMGGQVSIRWVIDEKVGADNFAMRVIEIEPGVESEYHHHPHEHEVFILSGDGTLVGQNSKHKIEADHVVFIPGGEMHQFINTGQERLRFLCLIPIKSACSL